MQNITPVTQPASFEKNLKPSEKTIRFILDYSKALQVKQSKTTGKDFVWLNN